MRRYALVIIGVLLSACWALAGAAETRTSHGISVHGEPKYGPDFKHFDYVDPNARKGGKVRLYAIGTFDSLNPFILKGVSAAGLGLLYDSLTYQSEDEAATEYGLIAETIEVPEDYSWVAYTLRPEARFHDGTPISAEDVIFSFELLKTRGHPFYRSYYANVVSATKVAERKVKFSFSEGQNRELPSIVGQLPVLPKAYWSARDFEATTLDPPLGNGPYAVESLEPGRSITWRRVEDYWGADLPVNVGRYNFGTIRFDYYRDLTVALEAFKAGEYDFRRENISKNWAAGYEGPALREGLIVMESLPNALPSGMQAFIFNTRNPLFADRRVREALGFAFDFEWTNKNLFYGAYSRTTSYFANSELASSGLPTPEELEVLEPFRGQVPSEVFDEVFELPTTDGSGNNRRNLRRAAQLLKEAGWAVKDGTLVHTGTSEVLQFEVLLRDPSSERITLPFKRQLERLGVEVSVRVVDTAQYQKRIDDFDFDMVMLRFAPVLSPGNEQRDYYGSALADTPGSRNLAGVRDPVVDQLVDLVVSAPDRATLVARTRALDRVLLRGYYVIPHWHIQSYRVAYWDKFARPSVAPKYGLGFTDTWWIDPARESALTDKRAKKGTN